MAAPKKFKSPKEMQEAISKYFEVCRLINEPYTIEGLCVHLDCTRQTLLNYEKEEQNEEFFDTIKKAKQTVLSDMVKRALSGDNNSTFSIFLLKNNFGYRDKQDHELTGKDGKDLIPNLTINVIESPAKLSNSEDEIKN